MKVSCSEGWYVSRCCLVISWKEGVGVVQTRQQQLAGAIQHRAAARNARSSVRLRRRACDGRDAAVCDEHVGSHVALVGAHATLWQYTALDEVRRHLRGVTLQWAQFRAPVAEVSALRTKTRSDPLL